ncbi:MAG: 50S ribosomal protein L23 [Candidatus Altiarchaeota archaeon]|nr:50S ribosomal protein L23 [Candidatus Altiarchaeota archaeon]
MKQEKVLLYPILTEKSFGLMEKENKLVFAVGRKATKIDVKKEFESSFNVKVDDVNVVNAFSREKKAIIKLTPDYNAGKIISDMGLM